MRTSVFVPCLFVGQGRGSREGTTGSKESPRCGNSPISCRGLLGIGRGRHEGLALRPEDGEVGEDLSRSEVDGGGSLGLFGDDLFELLLGGAGFLFS